MAVMIMTLEIKAANEGPLLIFTICITYSKHGNADVGVRKLAEPLWSYHHRNIHVLAVADLILHFLNYDDN